MFHLRRMLSVALVLLFAAGAVSDAAAATRKAAKSSKTRTKSSARRAQTKRVVKRAPEPPKPPYQAYILLEPETGRVLVEHEADKPWAPASLVKMMLTLIVMEEVEQGTITLATPVTVSRTASRIGGSQVYLKEGETFPLEQLMRAIEIASANDACVAVAEAVAGSQEAMVARMNRRARELGMRHTAYANVHGLPADPGNPENTTTARDTGVLAREIVRRFPRVLQWTDTLEAPFRNGKFTLHSTNRLLLGMQPDVDGLKTGYHNGAGFNLVATAERSRVRLVSVVLGSPSPKVRADETIRLLNTGFAEYERRVVLKSGETLPELFYVNGSEHVYVRVAAASDLLVFGKKGSFSHVRLKVENVRHLTAPAKKGDPVGEIVAVLGGERVGSVPAVVNRDVPKARLTWRIWNWRTPRPSADEYSKAQQRLQAGF
jgi:D-alanyl-D-alanine carboxypeptidase (penicillin-binding protein 5/6)